MQLHLTSSLDEYWTTSYQDEVFFLSFPLSTQSIAVYKLIVSTNELSTVYDWYHSAAIKYIFSWMQVLP